MSAILEPGVTCGPLPLVREAWVIVDGRDCYRAFVDAAERAENAIFMAGWQVDSRVRLLRGAEAREKGHARPVLRIVTEQRQPVAGFSKRAGSGERRSRLKVTKQPADLALQTRRLAVDHRIPARRDGAVVVPGSSETATMRRWPPPGAHRQTANRTSPAAATLPSTAKRGSGQGRSPRALRVPGASGA